MRVGKNLEVDKRKSVDCWDSLYTHNILDLAKFENNLNVHKSWEEFLVENIELLSELISRIRLENCTPKEPEKIFRFLKQDLSKIKVIILGQDPYPYPNFATGRAFEVENISNWQELVNPSLNWKGKSLQNMIICIYRNATGDTSIDKYDGILQKIEDKTFNISPPKPWFDSLEDQGVLFLNMALTCELNGEPGSHADMWTSMNDGFIKKLLKYINKKNSFINWFVWGVKAKECIKQANLHIPESLIFRSSHPAAYSLSIDNKNNFLNFTGFSQVTGIDWLGKKI